MDLKYYHGVRLESRVTPQRIRQTPQGRPRVDHLLEVNPRGAKVYRKKFQGARNVLALPLPAQSGSRAILDLPPIRELYPTIPFAWALA